MEMLGVELREEPEVYPEITRRGLKCKNQMIEDSLSAKIYLHIKNNPDKAFTSGELTKIFDKFVHPTNVRRLSDLGYVYRTPFKIPGFGKFGAYLYSWSQKSLWKRFWEIVPDEIKKCLITIHRKPYEIFCKSELIDLTEANPYDIYVWLDRIFGKYIKKAFKQILVKRKMVKGIRTFYYHPSIDEEMFQAKFGVYYKEKVLKERSLSKLDGCDFEDFACWTLAEYLKTKGETVELVRLDKEPVDYILKIKLDISDLYLNKQKEMVTHKYLISCKSYMSRPVSGNYILGLSGAVKEGRTFNNEEIFQIRNSIPILLCVHANKRAWNLAGKLGVWIFDVTKLMRMYDVVREKTGQEHPLFRGLKLKMEAFREYQKRGYTRG